jgi:hypothetical protein
VLEVNSQLDTMIVIVSHHGLGGYLVKEILSAVDTIDSRAKNAEFDRGL